MGLAICLLGAALAALGMFLPAADAGGIPIAGNSLAQETGGAVGLIAALVAAGLAAHAHRTFTSPILILLAGLLVAGTAIYNGVNGIELAPANPITGQVVGENLGAADPGIGLYVAGVGGALLIVGWLIQHRESSATGAPSAS